MRKNPNAATARPVMLVTRPASTSVAATLLALAAVIAAKTSVTPGQVVLRNRLQHVDSHNLRRVGAALDELARRVGFRVIPGLGERVIYRELFPKGLTLLDLQQLGEVGIAHITARQELREMIAGLGIPGADEVEPIAAAG